MEDFLEIECSVYVYAICSIWSDRILKERWENMDTEKSVSESLY